MKYSLYIFLITTLLTPVFCNGQDLISLEGNQLVLHYDFNTCLPTDQSGNGFDAIINGSPDCNLQLGMNGLLLNQNDIGTSCSASNAGDYITLPSMDAMWASGFTVSAWVRFEDTQQHFERIFDFGNGPGESGGTPVFMGRYYQSNDIGFGSWVSSSITNRSNVLVVENAIVNNSLQFFAATISGDVMKVYVNGKLKGTRTGTPILNVARANNYIGRSNWCTYDPNFKGFLGEFRLYNYALSENEIETLFNSTNPFSACTDPQASALMSIYNVLNGDNWTANTNWGMGCPCENPWFGVTCNSEGEVVELNLSENGLSGTLPRTDDNGELWGNLPFLEKVDFSGNSFSGLIPPEMGSLMDLRELNLSDNQFKGIFPEFLLDMDQLEILNLNRNELSGDLPTTIDQMTSLVELSLGQNGFTTVPSQIGNMTQLQRLTLSANPITDFPLPAELWTLVQLTDLGLSDLSLGTIPADISNLTQLAFLDIERTGISSFPSSFWNLAALSILKISGNTFPTIPTEIGSLSNLSELYMGEVGLTELPTELVSLANLSTLSFPDNPGLNCIPSEYSAFCGSLIVEDGGTTPVDFQAFCADGTDDCNPAPDPCEVEKAALMDLYNSTDGPNWKNNNNWGLESCPCDPDNPWFGVTCDEQGRVTQLSMNNNRLTGPIPESIGNLTYLEVLGLTETCNFTSYIVNGTCLNPYGLNGEIPTSICQLQNLRVLWLDGNELTGEIPSCIGSMTELGSLNLGGNFLTGQIPPEIGNLNNLGSLRLQNNNLTGVLPPELGNMENISYMNIEYNYELGGTIPPELANNTKLRNLWLCCNNLQGEIPTELETLSDLQVLLLDRNNLTGAVPDWVGNLDKATVITLGGNQLTSLPSSIGNLASIQNFLANDNLFTSIPEEIGNATTMKALRLGSNDLTNLPESIGNLTNLTFLGLGNNSFSTLPNSIGNLTNLTKLELDSIPTLNCFPSSMSNLCPTGVEVIDTGSTPIDFLEFCTTGENTCGEDCETEKAALLALYSATGGDNWTQKGNWDSEGCPCDPDAPWYGVTCNEEGKVVKLDLSQNNLVGDLSAEIGNLSQLSELKIFNNSLTSLPDALGNLSELKILFLTNNPLGSLPTTMSQLTKLEQLWAANIELGVIPDVVYEITNLRTLNLVGNDLDEIAPEVENLSNLTRLDIWGNNFQSLPNEMGNLTNLTWLELNENQLSDLPASFSNLTALSRLELHNNRFTEIPEVLSSMTSINVLWLGGCDGNPNCGANNSFWEFSIPGSNNVFNQFPVELLNLPNLSVLHMGGNQISCFPQEAQQLCGQLTNYSFGNNPADWDLFCSEDLFVCCANSSNLALGKTATQSSTYGNGNAGVAVDGVLTGNSPWTPNIQHTQTEDDPWWEVDLGLTADLESIVIHNRETNQFRMAKFYIFASHLPFDPTASLEDILADENVTQIAYQDAAIGDVETYPADVSGRYIRIHRDKDNQPLHMAEVEVYGCETATDIYPPSAPTGLTARELSGSSLFLDWEVPNDVGGGVAGYYVYQDGVQIANVTEATLYISELNAGTGYTYTVAAYDFAGNVSDLSAPLSITTLLETCGNLAFGKETNQSSTYSNGVSSLSVDGNLEGTTPHGTSANLQQTNREDYPWWEVDLGQLSTLEKVRIYNRTDCCQGAFSKFYLLGSAQPFDPNASLQDLVNDPAVSQLYYTTGNLELPFEDIPVSGNVRYVRLQLDRLDRILHLSEVEVYGCQFPLDETPPSIPENLVAENIQGNFVDLSWSESEDGTGSGVGGYNIYQNGVLIGTTTETSYQVENLEAGVTYSFQVSAFDNVGNESELSAPVSATTVASTCGNLALGKPAEQSSTYGNGVAGLAVDGNQTGTTPWTNAADLQHTTNEANPWWQVDLEGQAMIETIRIFNRSNSNQNRMRSFYLFISEQAFPSGASLTDLVNDASITVIPYNGSGQASYEFTPNVMGRYVRIQLDRTEVLHMSEVEVEGCIELIPPGPEGKTLQELASCAVANNSIDLVPDQSETPDRNYIKTTTYRQSQSADINVEKDWQSITYFDGLGRPIQSVDYQASPQGLDMVSPVEYDVFGRQAVSTLPYVDPTPALAGSFKSNWETQQPNFYQNLGSISGDRTKPFSLTQFEASPLNRVLEQGAPGNDWQPTVDLEDPYNPQNIGTRQADEHTIISSFKNNTNPVPGFNAEALDVEPTQTIAINGSYFPPHSLMIQEISDENGAITITATDKLRRTIYKSVQIEEGDAASHLTSDNFATTYFVYDSYGNVRYVIQPEGWKDARTQGLTPEIREHFCFQYEYDDRLRVKAKRVPGADWMYMVYDKLDRVVANQDGNLNERDEWLVTKYDFLGRPVMTGISSSPFDQSQMQNLVDNNSQVFVSLLPDGESYGDNLGPAITNLHSITYYDNYGFLTGNTYGFQPESSLGFLLNPTDIPVGYTRAASDQGRITGVRVYILNPAQGMPDYLQTVTYYDKYGREIQTIADNHLGGKELIANRFNFSGELLESVQYHNWQGSGQQRIHKAYVYDHRGRMKEVLQQINEDPAVVLAAQDYDELGQLVEKDLGGMDCEQELQSVDYQYNIRGWMTNINDLATNSGLQADASDSQNDLFGMQLDYSGLHNGNISAISWEHAVADPLQDVRRKYDFTYDKMNRLKDAEYTVTGSTLAENFTVPTITYDLNGNIQRLIRNGDRGDGTYGEIDNLVYDYSGTGNRLNTLSDNSSFTEVLEDIDHFTTRSNGSPYGYDASGNITNDPHKGFNFTYNHLNKPISAIDPNDENRSIFWIYSADGTKLRERYTGDEPATHDYVGGFFYKSNNLLHIAHEEGRALKMGDYFRYEFNLTDHLGNVRVSFTDVDYDGLVEAIDGEVLQVDQYYPFGMRLGGLSYQAGTENRFRYNGKEFHQELNLGLYDYGFRWYDPAVARFVSVDPLAEDFYYLTTYQYASNSPIWMIDLDGLEGVPATENGGVLNTAQSSTFRPLLEPIKEPSAKEKAGTIKERNPSFTERLERRVESGEASFGEELAYDLLNGPTMAITEFLGEGRTLGGRSLTGSEKQDAAAEFSSLALSEVSKTLQVGTEIFETILGLAKEKVKDAAQHKILTKGDIKLLKKAGLDPEELKGGKRTGLIDLWKTKDGEILIKPKSGKGPGEPTGYNLNNLNEVDE